MRHIINTLESFKNMEKEKPSAEVYQQYFGRESGRYLYLEHMGQRVAFAKKDYDMKKSLEIVWNTQKTTHRQANFLINWIESNKHYLDNPRTIEEATRELFDQYMANRERRHN